jgi:glutamyl-Q tRNA(Asp) synthetase
MARYIGRFAPTPSGALHAGSLVAALASWLDARAHGGRWLVRIEDVDGPRRVPGAEDEIMRQLSALGLVPDATPVRQSERGALYQGVLDKLVADRLAYPCACTRREIEVALESLGLPVQRGEDTVYPGTCRHGLAASREARAWRLRCGDAAHPVNVEWHDRRLGPQEQDVTHAVGDFVLKRADGPWAYQLAVVVDDAVQGVTDVVRGEDLADNTARQIHLQHLLGLPTPRYLHTPLLRDARGEKLSKSNGAPPLEGLERDPLPALRNAALVLGLRVPDANERDAWLRGAALAWRAQWLHPRAA